MKQFIISKNDSDQRLDKFVTKACSGLPMSQLYKYIRLKRIKVNGKKSDIAYKLIEGDLIELYLNDEYFEKPDQATAFMKITPNLDLVYEDEHILLVNKTPGIVVHEDDEGTTDTLINHIKAYLYQQKLWDPQSEHSFTPALCNRIDRNTGGIVIAAKTAVGLRVINEKIRDHRLEKSYLCLVHGTLPKKSGTIRNYLWKDEKQNRVFWFDKPKSGAKTAVTHYTVKACKKGISLVECLLETGRTHQIRVHMAALGCPVLGDTKYGTNKQNQGIPFDYQALYSYKLAFKPDETWGELSNLQGKTFQVEHIYFMDYFNNL